MANKIIIVGAGIAALSAIKSIREVDSQVDIELISNEEVYPYNRLKLTKNLLGDLTENSILLKKKEWYSEQKINIHVNKEVDALDIENNVVILSDGSKIKFDRLLLSSGSHNFKLPIDGIDKNNVYTIRQLKDALNIKSAVNKNKNPLVIGGGIQGLETAWELSKVCNSVVVAEMQERLMVRQLDVKSSKILKDAIEKFNVEIHLNTQIAKLSGQEGLTGAVKSNGEEIKCDMVIYNAGIRSNIDYIKDSTIRCNLGIIVDENMKTNIENIYAAGDVAEFDNRIVGTWSAATEQGKVAGYNIVGRNVLYKSIIPVTILNAFNISLFSMGNIDESYCDYYLIEEDGEKLYKRLFVKEDVIVGAIVIGDIKQSTILKTAIEKKTPISEFDISKVMNNYKRINRTF